MYLSFLLFLVLSIQPVYGEKPSGCGGQERYLEYEWDASWEPPEEREDFQEDELGADWPGKRQDPFFDTLTK